MIRRDFKDIEVSEEKWYNEAVRLRAGWSTLCRDGLERWREGMGTRAPVAVRDVMCEETYKETTGCNLMFKLFQMVQK